MKSTSLSTVWKYALRESWAFVKRDVYKRQVVGKLRGILKERRIGHGGTLDPMATGVLPVFVGRATRAIEFCENAEKEYVAGLKLGLETDTQDITCLLYTSRCV